jgi:hypothetical protein
MTKPTFTVCALQLLPALWGKSKIHLTLAAVLMPFALVGCVSFSSSSPRPPAKNTTIIVPPPPPPSTPTQPY